MFHLLSIEVRSTDHSTYAPPIQSHCLNYLRLFITILISNSITQTLHPFSLLFSSHIYFLSCHADTVFRMPFVSRLWNMRQAVQKGYEALYTLQVRKSSVFFSATFYSYCYLDLFFLRETSYSFLPMLFMLNTTVHLCKLLEAVIITDASSTIDITMTPDL